MLAAHVDLRKDVFVADVLTPRIDVVHHAVDLKQRDHLLAVIRYVERVRLSGRLIDVAAFFRRPVVFQVTPLPFQNISVDGLGVPVAGQNAGFPHFEQIDPVALACVQTQRPEPNVLGLGNPLAVVFR